MIAVVQIRKRMVHVVVSIVFCASDGGNGVLSQFLILFTCGGRYYYCVFLFVRTRKRSRAHPVFV